MKVKKYQYFILENNSNLKSDLIKYFDEQKAEIISKGLDFYELRDKFTKSINALDNYFLEMATDKLASVDINDKYEFHRVFEEILIDICDQLENANINESFFTSIKNFFLEIKKYISEAVKWISDRIWSISGFLTMGLAGLLFIINQWGGGLHMPPEFGNVLVNTILLTGVALLKYGRKNDEYKNISEI